MSNLYQFGRFRLDTQEQRLLSDGKPVTLTPKSFELLRVMVENPGRLLHKDELLRLVWPDSYVEEGNLSHHVFALRKALGDEKTSTQYIETVPRRGYRFIADVQEVKETDQGLAIATDNASLTDPAPHIPGVFVHDRRWPIRATASAVVILLATTVVGIVGYRWRVGSIHSAPSSALRQIAVLPFKPIVVADRDESLEWGMAETLITRLGGVSEIGVRPFGAVRRYGSLDQDPAAAGRELGVDAVLDGSMQRVGGRIRVTARLIRTSDGVPLWVRTFDENVGEIFALQDSISEQVVASLIPELAPQVRSHFGTRGLDPVWWTSSERWIRCPDRWQTVPSRRASAGGSMLSLRSRRRAWSSMKARASAPWRAISISPKPRCVSGSSAHRRTAPKAAPA